MENKKQILEEIKRFSFMTNYDPSKVISEQDEKGGFSIGADLFGNEFNMRGIQRSPTKISAGFEYDKELDKELNTAGDVLAKMTSEIEDEDFQKLPVETKNILAEGFYNSIQAVIDGQAINKENKKELQKLRKFFKKSQRWGFSVQSPGDEVEQVKLSIKSSGDLSTLEGLNRVMVEEVNNLNVANSQEGTILSTEGSYFYYDKKENDVSSNKIKKPILSALFARASKPLTTKELSPENTYITHNSFEIVVPKIPGKYAAGSSDPKLFISDMMKTILGKLYETSVSFGDFHDDPPITVKEMIECGSGDCDSVYTINIVGASIISSASNTWVNDEILDFTHKNDGTKVKEFSSLSRKGNNVKNMKLAKERANKLIQTVLTDVSKTPGIKLSESFDWGGDIEMEVRVTDTGGKIDKTKTSEFPNPGQYSEILIDFSVTKSKQRTRASVNQLKGEITQKIIVLKYTGRKGGGFDIDFSLIPGSKEKSMYLRKGLFGGHLKRLSDNTTNQRLNTQQRKRDKSFERERKASHGDRYGNH